MTNDLERRQRAYDAGVQTERKRCMELLRSISTTSGLFLAKRIEETGQISDALRKAESKQ